MDNEVDEEETFNDISASCGYEMSWSEFKEEEHQKKKQRLGSGQTSEQITRLEEWIIPEHSYFSVESLLKDLQLLILSFLEKQELLNLRVCSKHFANLIDENFLKVIVRMNKEISKVPALFNSSRVFGFDIEDCELMDLPTKIFPSLPNELKSLKMRYGKQLLHTVGEDISSLLPRNLQCLEATCLNWTQSGINNLPTTVKSLKELFWNKQIPDIEILDLQKLCFLNYLCITRPPGTLKLPSALKILYISSWRFRFQSDRLAYLKDAVSLQELTLKDSYVISNFMKSIPTSVSTLTFTECTVEDELIPMIPSTVKSLGLDRCRKLSPSALQTIPATVSEVTMGFSLHFPWETRVPITFNDIMKLPNTIRKLTIINYRMVYSDLQLPEGIECLHFYRCYEPIIGFACTHPKLKEVILQECYYDSGRRITSKDFRTSLRWDFKLRIL